MSIAQLAISLGEGDTFDSAGGVITDSVYFWGPDGRIERVANSSITIDGERTISITPGSTFADWVNYAG